MFQTSWENSKSWFSERWFFFLLSLIEKSEKTDWSLVVSKFSGVEIQNLLQSIDFRSFGFNYLFRRTETGTTLLQSRSFRRFGRRSVGRSRRQVDKSRRIQALNFFDSPFGVCFWAIGNWRGLLCWPARTKKKDSSDEGNQRGNSMQRLN